VAKFVTVFTIGHCITLIFATYFKITWNYYLVDAIIALSVMYKAFDNNGGFQKYFDVKSPNLLAAVFGFGLLHGFGLSTRLQQLPLGDDSGAMLLRILSFNLGVELGQIAALAAMVALLALWRHRPSFKKFSYAANLVLFYAACTCCSCSCTASSTTSTRTASASRPPSTSTSTKTWTSRTRPTTAVTPFESFSLNPPKGHHHEKPTVRHRRHRFHHGFLHPCVCGRRQQLSFPRFQACGRVRGRGLRQPAPRRAGQRWQARQGVAARQVQQGRNGRWQEG
jgi:hypothetical protein